MTFRPTLLAIILSLCAGLLTAQDEDPALTAKLDAVKGTPTKEAVLDLIAYAKEHNRPYTAVSALRGYFSRTSDVSRDELLGAADLALLSGEYDQAVARLRRYLAQASVGAESGEQAARLYNITVNLLHNANSAYQHMLKTRFAFREETPAVQRFDAWFLRQALARRDYGNLAFGIQRMVEGGVTPGEMHDFILPLFRRGTEALRLAGVNRDTEADAFADAIEALGDKLPAADRAAARFCVDTFRYRTARTLKDDKGMKAHRQALLRSAAAHIEAKRTAEAVVEVAESFGFHDDERKLDRKLWKEDVRGFLLPAIADAFTKLPADQQRQALAARVEGAAQDLGPDLGNLRQWWANGAKTKPVLAQALDDYGDAFDPDKPLKPQLDAYGKSGPPAGSDLAATLASLQAGKDLEAVAEHYFGKESWHRGSQDCWRVWSQVIEPGYRHLKGGQDEKARDEAIDAESWMASVGRPWLARSPLMQDRPTAVRTYLQRAWDARGNQEKIKAKADIEAIAWIPFDRRGVRDNRQGLRDADRIYENWRSHWHRKARDRKTPEDERERIQAMIKQADPIKGLLQSLRREDDIKPDTAPTAMTRAYARAKLETGDAGAFSARIQTLSKELAGYADKRLPFAHLYFEAALAEADSGEDVLPAQAEALRQLTGQWQQSGLAQDFIRGQLQDFCRRRDRWPDRIRNDDRASALRFNQVLGELFAAQIEAGEPDATTYDLFIATRRGKRWRDQKAGAEVLAKAIESGSLAKLFTGRRESAVAQEMYLVARESPDLQERFPLDTWFDDRYVAEAKAKRFVSNGYWENGGKDREGKVARAAAGILASYERTPTVPGTPGYRYSAEELSRISIQLFVNSRGKVDQASIAELEGRFGERYGYLVDGSSYFLTNPDLNDAEVRKTFFAKLAAWIERMRGAPYMTSHPSMKALSRIDSGELDADELDVLSRLILEVPTDRWEQDNGSERLCFLLIDGLVDAERHQALLRVAPHIWRCASDLKDRGLYDKLVGIAAEFFKQKHGEEAAAIAYAGLRLARAGMDDEVYGSLESVARNARAKFGAAEIPVPPGDPSYPLYLAQLQFQANITKGAWKTYRDPTRDLAQLHLELFSQVTPEFTLWTIRQHIDRGNFLEADELLQAVLIKIDDPNASATIPMRQRAEFELARADLANAQKNYPVAQARYRSIVDNADYEDIRPQVLARLRMADVARLQNNTQEAERILSKLEASPDTWTQARAKYYLAKLKIDQESYDDAAELLNASIDLDPNHPEANVLKGEVDLLRGKPRAGTSIELTQVSLRDRIRPGDPLRIKLKDRNKQISGRETSIELVVTADKTKDKVFMMLSQIGDDNDMFEGVIDTEMKPADLEDKVLQVFGNDRIRFDFSEAFKQKTNYSGPEQEQVLKVLSDAELYASSGMIQTETERERERLEAQLLAAEGFGTGRTRNAEGTSAAQKLAEARPGSEVRPGNSFKVKVVDHDKNYGPEVDKISINITTSSGDEIASMMLLETGALSGEFAGEVQTAKRPAYALASDTGQGVPNAVISPSDDLPPWVGSTTVQGPKHFTVDLNDLVNMAEMRIVSGYGRTTPDGGAVPFAGAIERLVVQTSLNNRNFKTVGAWPKAYTPWKGALKADLIPLPGGLPQTYEEIRTTFDVHRLDADQGRVSFTPSSKTMTLSWDQDLKGKWQQVAKRASEDTSQKSGRRRSRGSGPMVGVRLRAAFWVDRRTAETYYVLSELVGAGREVQGVPPRIFIDGEEITDYRRGGDDASGPQGFGATLKKGLHMMEVVYAVPVTGGSQADVTIKGRASEPPYTAVLPPETWDLGDVPPVIRDGFAPDPIAVTHQEDKRDFAIDFKGLGTRSVRLWILDYSGDAPQIKKIELNDSKGGQVLPIASDYLELQRNDTLEIAPGDKITVTYNDSHPFDEERRQHQSSLQATYYNGGVEAAFPLYGERGEVQFFSVRRFEYGDKVKVFVKDNDLDVSDQEDRAELRLTTSMGKTATITALETDLHSGVFEASFFPIEEGKGQGRPEELVIASGDDVTITYMDQENTDPGIPWVRTTEIEQVVWMEPTFRVYPVESQALPLDELRALEQDETQAGAAARTAAALRTGGSADVAPRYRMIAKRPVTGSEAGAVGEGVPVILGGPVVTEIEWPTRCKSMASELRIYAQTRKGRELQDGAAADGTGTGAETGGHPLAMDLSVPGTIELTSRPSNPAVGAEMPSGYLEAMLVGTENMEDALDEGRFSFQLPVVLGDCPTKPLWGEHARNVLPEDRKLFVTADDEVYIGFRWEDRNGTVHWYQKKVVFRGDPIFDVMNKRYQEQIDSCYVGEQAFLRIVDAMRDVSGDKDEIEVEVQTGSGYATTVQLMETLSHTAVFKSYIEFTHKDDTTATETRLNAIPVEYGDEVTITYRSGGSEAQRQITINRGADGELLPFTKRFKDPDIAMRTVFSISEAYFEMAKQHRALAEAAKAREDESGAERLEGYAREGIKSGRKLLNEAIRDFPENEIRAQADYLRAELSLELANDTENAKKKEEYYRQALNLFGGIVAEYGKTEYGPKALFKKAMVYEKMGDMELASSEYVKLSYAYPNHELIADTIARLGRHFFKKATGQYKQGQEAKEEDKLRAAELLNRARKDYRTAGRVFSKLKEHFPEHRLAAQTTCAAGQCMMWGHEFETAIEFLEAVAYDQGLQEPQTKAESLYWMTYTFVLWQEEGQPPRKDGWSPAVEAYKAANRLLLDYPESEWAKRARGLMMQSQDAFTDPSANR